MCVNRMKELNKPFKSMEILAQTTVQPEMHRQIHLQLAHQWSPKMFNPKRETCTCMEHPTIDPIKYSVFCLFLLTAFYLRIILKIYLIYFKVFTNIIGM